MVGGDLQLGVIPLLLLNQLRLGKVVTTPGGDNGLVYEVNRKFGDGGVDVGGETLHVLNVIDVVLQVVIVVKVVILNGHVQ